MKLRRIILNLIVALAVGLAAAPLSAGPAYAAPARGGGGGGGGGAGGGGGGGAGGGGGGGGGAAASTCPSDASSKGQVLQGLGQTGSDCSDAQVDNTLKTAVTILSLVVGIASVIVIIISGFKYIASGGDQNRVSNAKNSLLYALIGVAVAALAQFMIHFILFNTNQ